MIATGILVVIVALVFARLAYGLILPFMREGLGLDYQQAGNLGTAAALGYLCLIMASGIFAARWGGNITIVIGALLSTTGFIGLSVSSDYYVLLAWMALLGFGTAFSYTPAISLLVGWFPHRRAGVIGIANSGAGIGLLLAGSLVPYLGQAFGAAGWRITWGVFALAGAMTAIAAYFLLPNPPALVAEGTATKAAADRAIYRNRNVIRIGLLYAIIGSMYVVQAIFMYSFALKAGLSGILAGRLAAMSGVLSIFSGPACGWLADRFGRRKIILALVIADMVAMALPVIWPNLPGFGLHYFVIGAVMSGLFTVILAATTEAVTPAQAPVAVSYVTLFYAVAQLICPALAGLLIERTGGFQPVFVSSAALIAVALFLGFRLQLKTAGSSLENTAQSGT
jgi:MFS family permease